MSNLLLCVSLFLKAFFVFCCCCATHKSLIPSLFPGQSEYTRLFKLSRRALQPLSPLENTEHCPSVAPDRRGHNARDELLKSCSSDGLSTHLDGMCPPRTYTCYQSPPRHHHPGLKDELHAGFFFLFQSKVQETPLSR